MKLDQNNLQDISNYLQAHGILKPNEFVARAEKPGEGNMNCTLRLFVNDKTYIIKQARPYVEKYPSIPAPQERILVESEFYHILSVNDFLSHHMPKILLSDPENHLLLMEDLGEASDFTALYKKGNQLDQDSAKMCTVFLNELHANFKTTGNDGLMANHKLKTLNHEHIFVYPFLEENGFDLDSVTPGLQEASMLYKKDERLKEIARQLGEVYLASGDTLLHGDYYPGSWLKTADGLMVIDPEFAFYGRPEFDLGVLYAHLNMAQQNEEVFETLNRFYKKSVDFDETLFRKFTGIEMMRRMIGLAQLPLDLDLTEKKALLKQAMELLNE